MADAEPTITLRSGETVLLAHFCTFESLEVAGLSLRFDADGDLDLAQLEVSWPDLAAFIASHPEAFIALVHDRDARWSVH